MLEYIRTFLTPSIHPPLIYQVLNKISQKFVSLVSMQLKLSAGLMATTYCHGNTITEVLIKKRVKIL